MAKKQTQFDITNEILSRSAEELGLTKLERYIFVQFSVYFGYHKEGDKQVMKCFPSQSEIAKMTGSSRKSVNEALSKLESLGYISARENKRANGSNTSKVYYWFGFPNLGEQTQEQMNTASDAVTIKIDSQTGFIPHEYREQAKETVKRVLSTLPELDLSEEAIAFLDELREEIKPKELRGIYEETVKFVEPTETEQDRFERFKRERGSYTASNVTPFDITKRIREKAQYAKAQFEQQAIESPF